jgi:hypothetical protein
MIADTLACILLVLGVALGLSRPAIGWFRLTSAEALVAGAALSLVAAWALAWTVFATGCPLWAYCAPPALAAAFLLAGWRGTRALLADPAARDLAVGQLIVTGWCVAWLSLVKNHSGALWAGDSFEHWERARFFLRDWPAGRLFIGTYSLPSRPPLANVLAAAFMRPGGAQYFQFQVVSAALASLAYLPVGLLAQRFGGPRAARIAAVILMVNPMFVQNATYPWTKLQAAFFVLAGFYFFLRVRDRDGRGRRQAVLCALLLGAAFLTHYSAGPYIVVLAAAWLAMGWSRRGDPGFARMTAWAALAGALVLAPWFCWSVAHFGWGGTFLSNTSVNTLDRWKRSHLQRIALNLLDTLVPPQARGYRNGLLAQSSPWGTLRDQLFLIYQLNLPLALGCVGWIAAAREAFRCARAAAPRDLAFWSLLCAGLVVGCVAVFGDRDQFGLAHICLQSFVLLCLAFLASRWEGLGRGWRAALAAGWTVDFVLGIALQFAVEDFAPDRWFTPGRSLGEVALTYNVASQLSLNAKMVAHLSYFADILPVPPALALALLGAILCMALARARRAPAGASPQ